jgi:TPP-dependent 2-oxoacid decarboxylase
MATLPTPEESARAILAIFALQNSRPDDVLMAEQGNFAFRQAGGTAAEFQAGLEYAVQNGWLEIGNDNTIKLTNAGFTQM